jgi:subfamily B ATP-binding cassette protein MsbA
MRDTINDSPEKRFFRYVLRQWRPLLVALLCSLIVTGITFVVARLLEITINSMNEGKVHILNLVCLSVIGVFALKWFFTFGQVYYLSLASQHVVAQIRHDIFSHLQRLPLSFFNRRRVGAIQSVIANDVPVLQNAVVLVRDSLDAPLRIFGGLLYVFYLNWKLALLACLCLPLMALVIQRIGKQIRKITHITQVSLADITALVEETIAGVRVVKTFAMEDREVGKFAERNYAVLHATLTGERRRARLRPTVELIGAVGIALVLWFGGREVALSHMNSGQLLSFLFILHQIAQAANGVGSIHVTRQQIRTASERIYGEVLDVHPEVYDPPNGVELPRLEGRIEFEEVSFAYAEEEYALREVSFTIKPGEIVALVGHSGAGKSTLVDLLLRFHHPHEGRILVDSHDIQNVKLESLRAQIGVVPQQTILFVGTAAENIAYGKPGAGMDDIMEAARAAHAAEFIERLPQGYDTLIGDKGVRLSGGESQRVAIARALLKSPRILVLDEATSALDTVSERMIQQALEEERGKLTILLIAHRWSTIQCADRVLVMHRGKLVEQGTHEELMRQNGYYTSLYRAAVLETEVESKE